MLRRGDLFRAKGGPYYIGPSGQKIKMAERGPFRFAAYCERGSQKWIEAYSVRVGGFAILSLTEREGCLLEGSYVPRPYSVAGRVTGRAKVRIEGRNQPKKKRTVVIEAADVEPVATMGRPDKAGRREGRRAAASRRNAGGRRAAIQAVLAGLSPIAQSGQ